MLGKPTRCSRCGGRDPNCYVCQDRPEEPTREELESHHAFMQTQQERREKYSPLSRAELSAIHIPEN